jgi:predicted nucleotidyltransferase
MTRAETLRKLRNQADAIKALGATSLYLFGSTARDKASAKSDVDVFIDYDPRGRFNALDLVAADCSRRASASKLISPPAKGCIR